MGEEKIVGEVEEELIVVVETEGEDEVTEVEVKVDEGIQQEETKEETKGEEATEEVTEVEVRM